MNWSEGIASAWGSGTFWVALGAALVGFVLLWILRPVIARKIGGEIGAMLAPKRRDVVPGSTGEVDDMTSHPDGGPKAEEIPVPMARARAAYAGLMGAEKEHQHSSSHPGEPIEQDGEAAIPTCPPELSRRIDRIEAKVRARKAGSRG